MSSTGFFHSRLCGTLADAGCWAFMLGVIVIHPPKKTQPHAKFDLVAAMVRLLLELTMQDCPCTRCLVKLAGPLYYSIKE
jgi:hypothetical protein